MLFFDFETRSCADLKKVGAHRYAAHPSTHIMLLAYAFDKERVRVWSPQEGEPVPEMFAYHARNYHVAWNCEFDELIWRMCGSAVGLPEIKPDKFLDAMAQGAASLYPADLKSAALINPGDTQKMPEGKRLIQKFAIMESETEPMVDFTDPDWALYKKYALDDVGALRSAWRTSAPMTVEGWEDYRTTREINDRGLPIDRKFCELAAPLLVECKAEICADCTRLTGGEITSPTQSVRIRNWLMEKLPQRLIDLAVTKVDSEGEATAWSFAKIRLEGILYEIEAEDLEIDENVRDFLDLLVHGRNISADKLVKMYNMSTNADPVVRGSYNLNGAGKTGRFSSRGIQMHNLPRDYLEGEFELFDALLGSGPEVFKQMVAAKGLKVNYALSRMVRPALLAPGNDTFVWGDWSQIEARLLPWLTDSRQADGLIKAFADGEDVYVREAASIFNVFLDQVTKEQRQAGKVAQLALGFGGGVNAYQVMARNYGLRTSRAESQVIVDAWRKANPWARVFWNKLEAAFTKAINNPGLVCEVGRVRYVFVDHLMRGTVVCELPCGRCLMYPEAKIRTHTKTDWNGKETVQTGLSHRGPFTYVPSGGKNWNWTWGGTLAENVTQATAGSLLRRALRMLRASGKVVGHTHDEILMQVQRGDVAIWEAVLRKTMLDVPVWAEGLPIDAEVDSWTYYTKANLNKLKEEASA